MKKINLSRVRRFVAVSMCLVLAGCGGNTAKQLSTVPSGNAVSAAAADIDKEDSGDSSVKNPASDSTGEEDVKRTHKKAGKVRKVKAELPEILESDKDLSEFLESGQYEKWWKDYGKKVEKSAKLQKELRSFYESTLKEFLVSDAEENRVYSPLNVYLALAMLAETASGETRSQILDVLNAADMETLEQRVASLFGANYCSTPQISSLPANSLWLNEKIPYKKTVLDTLAKKYYASSFSGVMGSPEMNEALQNWTNKNTKNLLKEYTSDMSMTPATVLELVSTIYYKAAWSDPFYEEATEKAVFHGAKGDEKCDMMQRSQASYYYRGDNFGAVSLGLQESGKMYFFLPDEGVSLNDVAGSDQIMEILEKDEEYKNGRYVNVNLKVPKFNLSSKIDMREPLKKLGMTDAFQPEQADFSELADQKELEKAMGTDKIFVNKVDHAAMVTIDEDGVTGAAYTEIGLECGAAMIEETVDFTVDRPFYYVVTGLDGSILFAGTAWDLKSRS